MKKIFIFFTFFSISFAFSQKDIKYQLNNVDISKVPFYQYITKEENEIKKLKKEYEYTDSLDFKSLTYKSFDDLEINGFLVRPKKDGIYPVLIFNRGGNASLGAIKFAFVIDFLGKIAQKGYVVIGSNLRGSKENNGNDEFGGKDVQDALDIIKIIDNLNYVDNKRIGVFGWSRGVMTNFLMLKNTYRIKTNIAIAGQADLALTDRKEMFDVYRERIPNFDNDRDNLLKQRSSILAIESIQNKQLSNFIIHGNTDSRVKVDNAFSLYNKLIENKFQTKLLIYDNEDHDLKNVQDNLLENIYNWLSDKL